MRTIAGMQIAASFASTAIDPIKEDSQSSTKYI
jgi:hypothetical protein